MKQSAIKSLVFGLVVVSPATAFAGPKPTFFPNEHLKKVGEVASNRDVIECEVMGRDFLERNAPAERASTGRQAVRGAARGAAVGALGGAITKGNVGRSVGAGAAIGGTTSAVRSKRAEREELQHGSPELQNFMQACLEEKGYKIVGWR